MVGSCMAVPIRILYPDKERIEKSCIRGKIGSPKSLERPQENGTYCFDLFAVGTAKLLEGCIALLHLVADRFPLIIVDEFQDTDDSQWGVIRALSKATDVCCLADPESANFRLSR